MQIIQLRFVGVRDVSRNGFRLFYSPSLGRGLTVGHTHVGSRGHCRLGRRQLKLGDDPRKPGQGEDGGSRRARDGVAGKHSADEGGQGRREVGGPGNGVDAGDDARKELGGRRCDKGEAAGDGDKKDDAEGIHVGRAAVKGGSGEDLGRGISGDTRLRDDRCRALVCDEPRVRQVGNYGLAALRVREEDATDAEAAEDNAMRVRVRERRGDLGEQAAGGRDGHATVRDEHGLQVGPFRRWEDNEATRGRAIGACERVVGQHTGEVRVRRAAQDGEDGTLLGGEERDVVGRAEDHGQHDSGAATGGGGTQHAPMQCRATVRRGVDDVVPDALHGDGRRGLVGRGVDRGHGSGGGGHLNVRYGCGFVLFN